MSRLTCLVSPLTLRQYVDSDVSAFFLLILSLPFLAIGFMTMERSLSAVSRYARSGSWESVPAQIDRLQRVATGSANRNVSHGWLEIDYTYDWDGHSFTTSHDGMVAARRLPLERFGELAAKRAAHEPLSVLVNPSNPAESQVSRSLTSGDIGLLSFGAMLFSLGLMWGWTFVVSFYQVRRLDRLRWAAPSRPWTHEGRWPSLGIDSSPVGLVGIWWIAGLAILFTWPQVFVSLRFEGGSGAGFFGFLSLGSTALLGYAAYLTLRHLKYGRSRLLLPQLPLVPGESFPCEVVLNHALIGDAPVRLTLCCTETFHTREHDAVKGRDYHHTVEKKVYEGIVEFDRSILDRRHRRIAFTLSIPIGFPDHTVLGNPKYTWELETRTAEPGVDYRATFLLPVFRVSSPALVRHRPSLALE